MHSEQNMPRLNAAVMLKPILRNFDEHIENFIGFLRDRILCSLVYDGPTDIQKHIWGRTVYACSVKHVPTGKLLKNVLPIMLGSRLDIAIRHLGVYDFEFEIPTVENPPFQTVDIGRGFFIICGSLRQLPYFFTNDSSRTHLVKNSFVRVYSYDRNGRGKEMTYHVCDQTSKKRGDLTAKCNKGKESKELVTRFFDFCPYPTCPAAYMTHVYRHDNFQIDSLKNKIVMSPGHLFTKLFIKFLYEPLRQENWSAVKSKTNIVVKSIQSGNLLPVISRKTNFFKEGKSPGKMVNTNRESFREIAASGEVFMEKVVGCYREINSQTYPLNPYLTYMIVRQVSAKVKNNSVPSFHDSYVGFICILGCFETKVVGRTSFMARDTYVSTSEHLNTMFSDQSDFWDWLKLELNYSQANYFVVINEACISVTESCFLGIDLLKLKLKFKFIECFQQTPFIFINLRSGEIFKRLPDTDIWVTPKDLMFWAQKLLSIHSVEDLVEKFGYNFITSYHVDLNPFFMHNTFPKNILAFNALKNAVLATDSRYAHYFMDTTSTYAKQFTQYHRNLLEPAQDGISHYFTLYVPLVTVAYMSFSGCTQEDGIVCRKDLNAFDCCRFFTLRAKFMGDGIVKFHQSSDDSVIGIVVHHGRNPLRLEPLSVQLKPIRINDHVFELHVSKTQFHVVLHTLTDNVLTVCMEQIHLTEDGDKLCSFHGQKGVMRLYERLPLLDDNTTPDLLINPYCLFRMTPGQIREGLFWGGKDAETIKNSDGRIIPNSSAFYAKTRYFPVCYWSSEHLYAPSDCNMDKILGQAVRGRSRGGGMRLGIMEMFNGIRANGIASCFEEKFFEHGDRYQIPKSVELFREDVKFFKCNFKYDITPNVTIEKKY